MRRRPPGFSAPPPSASRDLVSPEAGLGVRAGLGADATPGDALRLPAPPKSRPETPAEMADQAWSKEGAAGVSASSRPGPRVSRSEGESNPVVVLIRGCDCGLGGFRATGVAGGFPNPGAGRGWSTDAVGPTNALTRAASRSAVSASRVFPSAATAARGLPPDSRRSKISSNCMSSSASAAPTPAPVPLRATIFDACSGADNTAGS